MGEKDRYIAVPIPSYEEATSSRPTSSGSYTGPEEISDDAEREGLLQHERTSNYEPPRVDSARSSVDLLASDDGRHSAEDLRREVEQMEIEDPTPSRQTMTNLFSKRISSFTQSLSSLHLPFTRYFPSFDMQSIKNIMFSTEGNGFIIVGRLFGIFLIVSVVYLLIASDVISFGNRAGIGQIYDPESIRIYVQKHMNEDGNIENYLERLTLTPHIAGSEGNYVLAEWVQELFKESLEEVSMERFDVYLNYPRPDGRSVAIVEPPEKRWEAKLDETPDNSNGEVTLNFHGYSKSGNVSGPLVYANYGSREDFQYLADNGIEVNGAIALVRYGGTQRDRSLKVKAAELAGAVGCIIYSDPAQDGFVGQTMPIDGVQRGSVGLTTMVAGDPLSPGWASTPGEKKRLKLEEATALNSIPSIPLSWGEAQHLLQALSGHGKHLADDWKGKLLADSWMGEIPDVDWWSGDQTSPTVQLANIQDEETYQPIYNVLGTLTGWEQPDKRVVIGNHRDAWCLGAVDPGSGTAIMLEVMRIIGELRKLGWRPLRTIEFASWDAEEYNLVGSTEHVEQRMEELRLNGCAYINIDVGVSGPDFWASASPVFQRPLLRILDRVSDPRSNRTLREIWDENERRVGGLGAGSDFVAFQDIVGTSSLDFGFNGSHYPYHSCYDNFDWMKNVGDPGFAYHKAMGEIFALMVLEIADRPVLPFDMQNYAASMSAYIDDLASWVSTKPGGDQLDFRSLRATIDRFHDESALFEEWEREWTEVVYGSNGFESNVLGIRRIDHNNRMANFDTHLLDLEENGGLVNRTQFKHVLFAPDRWSGYDAGIFPSIRDAVNIGDWSLAKVQLDKVERIVSHAVNKLNHNN